MSTAARITVEQLAAAIEAITQWGGNNLTRMVYDAVAREKATGHDAALRDHFASQALAVMCASNVNATGTFACPDGRATVANVCYQMADAMLAARNAKPAMEPT